MKINPLFSATSVIIVKLCVIFAMYRIGILENITCDTDFGSVLSRNFIHTDLQHLLSNVLMVIILYRIENEIGLYNYIQLIISILISVSLLEMFASRVFKLKCSIGYSGVIFALIAWEVAKNQKLDIFGVMYLLLILYPSVKNNNISFSGHLIGIISGILVYYLFYETY